MNEKHQRLSTKALIEKDGKYLLVCEPNNKWEMPGGKPDWGEHMEDTIARELSEELGISAIKNHGIVGQFDFIATAPKYHADYQFVCLIFKIDIGDQAITLSDEHIKYGYFTTAEIQDLDIKPEYKEFFSNFRS